jgi:peptidoglycan hydrolase-like protein with peptidoglycan-binding domain
LTRTSAKSGPLLWRGSESAEVLAVQKALGVTAPNSYFGPRTMRAVADYQRGKSLPVTGAVDTETRAALASDGVLKR